MAPGAARTKALPASHVAGAWGTVGAFLTCLLPLMSRFGLVSLALLVAVSLLLLGTMRGAKPVDAHAQAGATARPGTDEASPVAAPDRGESAGADGTGLLVPLLGSVALLAGGALFAPRAWRRRKAGRASRAEGPDEVTPVDEAAPAGTPCAPAARPPNASTDAGPHHTPEPAAGCEPRSGAAIHVTPIGATFDAYRRALERNEFTLHYQARVRLANGEVTGYEALLRRTRPAGAEEAATLVELAEQSAFGPRLGEWILRAAARQSLVWRQSGVTVPIAVNISASQFCDPGFLRLLDELAAADPALTSHLELELSEAALTLHGDGASHTLRELGAMGFAVQIDHFGTAASNLQRLGQGPVRALKIDRSLVLAAPASAEAGRIVRASVALAQAMDLNVIAVGVETAEQYRFLQSWGCREAQGFLFMPPMAPMQALQVWRGQEPQ